MSERIDKTMSIGAANVWALVVAIPVFVGFFGAQAYFWGYSDSAFSVEGLEGLWALVIFFLSIVVHELLHGLGYWLGGAKWSEVKFGVKQLTPYAHCQVPLKVWPYRFAVALPGLVLGVAPAVIALFTGSWLLMAYGTLMTASAAGDMLILWLLRDVPPTALVQDHPSKVGSEVLI